MKYSRIFLSAILAGFCIALGGVVYLSLENKILGALFFTVGLFAVCSFGFHLFTGKVCYVFQKDVGYAVTLPVIWLGNFVGTWIVAGLIRLTRLCYLSEKALTLCQIKLDDSFLSLFVLGLLCNVFIYLGVEGYLSIPHATGKYLALFFGVMVFILCGYEHCVADMFYFSLAGCWSMDVLLRLLIITLGNTVGGVLFPTFRKLLSQQQ